MVPLQGHCIVHLQCNNVCFVANIITRAVEILCPICLTCSFSLRTSKKFQFTCPRSSSKEYPDYEIHIFFLFLEENICCGYSLEAPH